MQEKDRTGLHEMPFLSSLFLSSNSFVSHHRITSYRAEHEWARLRVILAASFLSVRKSSPVSLSGVDNSHPNTPHLISMSTLVFLWSTRSRPDRPSRLHLLLSLLYNNTIPFPRDSYVLRPIPSLLSAVSPCTRPSCPQAGLAG